MDFVTAVKTCFGKYATFSGRACRSEYWFFALFFLIVLLIAGVVDAALEVPALQAVVLLALFVPSLAANVRRLHDIDRSGWWYLITFIPLIGGLLLIFWFCGRGTAGPNRFGEDPLPLALPQAS
jgi:uncharacterized membrane protein YhaH (DUF805 family)